MLIMIFSFIGIEGWHAVKSHRHNNSHDDVLTDQVVGGMQFSLKFKSDDVTATMSKIWLEGLEIPTMLDHLLMTTSSNNVVPFELKSSEKVNFVTFCVCVTSIRVRLSSREKYYIKYKLLDNDSACSSIITSSSAKFRKLFVCKITDRLVAGLRDEPLKVELWRKEVIEDDIKVGSFCVDMTSLLKSCFQNHERCGGEVFNFYGRKIEDVRNTSARCYVSCTPGEHKINFDDVLDIKSTSNYNPDTFTVSVMVETLMHFPTVDVDCFCFVSFRDAAENRLKTKKVRIKQSNNQEPVVWNEAKDIRLPVTCLSSRCDEKFKLCVMTSAYEDNEGDDNVIGEAEVDVSLLMSSSFELICGWYNVICRKTGRCNGQLKVSIAPTCNMNSINVQQSIGSDFEIEKSLAPLPIVETPSRANCYVTGVDAPPKEELEDFEGEYSMKNLCPDVSKILRKKIKELEEVRKKFTTKINNLNKDVDKSNIKKTVPLNKTIDCYPLKTQKDIDIDEKIEKDNKCEADVDGDVLLPRFFNIVTSSPNSSQLVDKNHLEETSLWSAGENCDVLSVSERQHSGSDTETEELNYDNEAVHENVPCDSSNTNKNIVCDDEQVLSTISQNESDCENSFEEIKNILNGTIENKSILGDSNDTSFENQTAEEGSFCKYNVKTNHEHSNNEIQKQISDKVHVNESNLEITENREIDQASCESNKILENIILSEGSFDEHLQSTSNFAQGLIYSFHVFILTLKK